MKSNADHTDTEESIWVQEKIPVHHGCFEANILNTTKAILTMNTHTQHTPVHPIRNQKLFLMTSPITTAPPRQKFHLSNNTITMKPTPSTWQL